MTARFRHGLVVGKFSPLHRGHEFLVNHAQARCDQVTVLSYSNPELPRCNAASRQAWLRHCVRGAEIVVLDDTRLARLCWVRGLPVRRLPCNGATDDDQRAFVAWVCQQLLRVTVDAVFTSETYGDGFAAHLTRLFAQDAPEHPGVVHCLVDLSRAAHPVSGTEVRAEPSQWRDSVDPFVYADFVPRICILGGESSGKTTLSQALATVLGAARVPEYGRTHWERKGHALDLEDLDEVASTQVAHEVQAAQATPRWVVCDTSPLTTLVYALLDHGRPTRRLVELSRRSYDLIVVCAPDFPFVQDGTRRDAAWRSTQHALTLDLLKRRSSRYMQVSGPIEQRVTQVLEALN